MFALQEQEEVRVQKIPVVCNLINRTTREDGCQVCCDGRAPMCSDFMPFDLSESDVIKKNTQRGVGTCLARTR